MNERDEARLSQLGIVVGDFEQAQVILGASVLVVPTEQGNITILLDPAEDLDRQMIESLPAVLLPEVRVPFVASLLGRESLKVQVQVVNVVRNTLEQMPLRERIEAQALARLEETRRQANRRKLEERLDLPGQDN